MTPVLHGYWRSTASYRVRIALNLKGAAYEQVTHDLRTGAQHDPAYLAIAPQGLVPVLETEDGPLSQSLAILEWAEERWPEPYLLPPDRWGRAIVRSMVALIGADIHPLNNLRVLEALRRDFAADQNRIDLWIERWIGDGFAALDVLIAAHGGAFAYGDAPSLADCLVVPQVYSAERFSVDLAPYPHVRRVAAAALALEPVARAHPSLQPDSDAP